MNLRDIVRNAFDANLAKENSLKYKGKKIKSNKEKNKNR